MTIRNAEKRPNLVTIQQNYFKQNFYSFSLTLIRRSVGKTFNVS